MNNKYVLQAYQEYMQARAQYRSGYIAYGALSQYREQLRSVYRLVVGK